MNEKELQSYIKELETALILTYNDKMSWQIIGQVANNNIRFFKVILRQNNSWNHTVYGLSYKFW